ncbi:hypothetical protein BU17DRAFT_66307 [Hysterangium stoloniferum]|nr:hypothetical protein BU17DRAFT_66307 [Hysterangium stoloniferum]
MKLSLKSVGMTVRAAFRLSPPMTKRMKNALLKRDKGRGRTESNEDKFGIKVLAEGDSPTVDIVAVHGLDGDREKSWTADNGNCWLRDFLLDHVPQARILTYGYDAYTRYRNKLSEQFLHDVGGDLVEKLAMFRAASRTTACDSGIVLKSVQTVINIVRAAAIRSIEKKSIYPHTASYSSVHQGAEIVLQAIQLLAIASRANILKSNIKLLKHLKPHSERLQVLQSHFNDIAGDFVIKSGYELNETPLIGGKRSLLVPRESAVMQGATNAEEFGIHANHIEIAKFPSEDADGCRDICQLLKNMVIEAPAVIQARFPCPDE